MQTSGEPSHRRATDRAVALAIAVAAGALSTLAGLEPTGTGAVDVVMVFAVVSAATWFGSLATPRVLVLISAAHGAIGLGSVRFAVTCFLTCALCVGLVRLGRWRRASAAAVAGAISVNTLLLPEFGRFGSSALVAGVTFAALIYLGLHRLGPSARRWGRFGLIWAVEATVIVAALVAGTALRLERELRDTDRLLRAGLQQLRSGELDAAAESVGTARVLLDEIDSAVNSPAFTVARAVPVLAQHVTLLQSIAGQGRLLADLTERSLADATESPLRLENGGVDLVAIERLTDSFDRIGRTLASFNDTLSSPSSWLVSPARRKVDDLSTEAASGIEQVERLQEITPHLGSLMGAEGVRRYFVAFLTPAEARGLGGFLGSFAELEFSDGAADMVRFGRIKDLFEVSRDPEDNRLNGPAEYLRRYAPYGLAGAGEPNSGEWWNQITLSPDFPSVASVIQQLYSNGSGRPIDGVIAMTPAGIARLIEVTGPVELASVGRTIDAGNAETYLERDQYVQLDSVDNDDRIDALETIARTTFDRLLSSSLNPIDLIQALGPAAADGQVMVWSNSPEEQQAFVTLGLDGAFTLPPAAPDGLSLVNANGGPNKLDAFLERSIRYDATIDETTGALSATAVVTLRNTAPDGLPDYVADNVNGTTPGTNRMTLTLYSAHSIVGSTVDGEAATPTSVDRELGWNYFEQIVTVPPASTITVEYTIEGRVDPALGYAMWIHPQRTVNEDSWSVSAQTRAGVEIMQASGVPRSPGYLRE